MAVDMFLKIDRRQGRSSRRKAQGGNRRARLVLGHEPVRHHARWRWWRRRQGRRSGPVHHQMDRQVVPGLMKYCSSGKQFKEAILTVRKAGGKEPARIPGHHHEGHDRDIREHRRLGRRGPPHRERLPQLRRRSRQSTSRRSRTAARMAARSRGRWTSRPTSRSRTATGKLRGSSAADRRRPSAASSAVRTSAPGTENPMRPIEDSLREGNLEETLRELQDQVRKAPANAKQRVFLFQLLALMGQWERAMTQLNVAGELDAGTLAMVQTYREALRCEVLRGEIFAGKRSPLVFGEPEEWFALLLESQTSRCPRGGRAGQRRCATGALEAAPTTPGTIDGVPFEWIMDGDSRLGPVRRGHRQRALLLDPLSAHPLHPGRRARGPARSGVDAGLLHLGQRRRIRRVSSRPATRARRHLADPEVRRGRRPSGWSSPAGPTSARGSACSSPMSGSTALMEVRRIDLERGTSEAQAGTGSGEALG